MRRALLAVAFLAIVVAGCRIETNIGLDLNADGSGTAVIDVGLDDEAIELIGAAGGGASFEESCTAGDAGLTDVLGENPLQGVLGGAEENAEVSLVTEGDLTICRASIAFDDVSTFTTGSQDGLDLDVSVTDEEVRISGTLEGDQLGDGGGNELFDPALLEDVLAFHVRVKMPGTVIESDADRTLSDGTLEWDIDLFGGTGVSVQAVSDPSGGGGGFPVWIVVLTIAVIAAAVFFFMRSRSSRAAPAGDAGAATADAPPPPPQPPTVASSEDLPPPPPTV